MKKNNDQKANLPAVWNKMWDWQVYSDDDLRKYKSNDKLRIIKEMGVAFRSGQKIMDGGCGDGRSLISYVKEFGCSGYGLDLSENALNKAAENARKENCQINFQKGDVRKLPYEDDFFDGVLSFGVIEHFLDYETAIKEMFRVLAPGGRAIFIQPHKFSFGPLYRIFRQLQKKWNCGFQFEFSGRGLGQATLKCGFSKYKYRVEGPYKDMPYIYHLDHFFRLFSRKWGHYLFLIAEK
jgi:ubiquinone/menaquinone biosynthesis C-methylase UbiE